MAGIWESAVRSTVRDMTNLNSAPRVDVLGVSVSAVNLNSTVETIEKWIEQRAKTYICVTGVHGVMESQQDEALMAIHNGSGMTVPDGMPLVWFAHSEGYA